MFRLEGLLTNEQEIYEISDSTLIVSSRVLSLISEQMRRKLYVQKITFVGQDVIDNLRAESSVWGPNGKIVLLKS